MTENKVLCIVCAWRATCQKQFSMKAGQKCAEFVRDVSIKEEKEEDKEKENSRLLTINKQTGLLLSRSLV